MEHKNLILSPLEGWGETVEKRVMLFFAEELELIFDSDAYLVQLGE